MLSSRSKHSQSSLPVSSQGLPEPAYCTGSHSRCLPNRQCAVDSKPTGNSVDRVTAILRERSNIDRLTVKRPLECRFSVTERVPRFVCNFASSAQTHGSLSLIGQREGAFQRTPQSLWRCRQVEITAAEADAKGICFAPRVLPEPRSHECQSSNPSPSRMKAAAHLSPPECNEFPVATSFETDFSMTNWSFPSSPSQSRRS